MLRMERPNSPAAITRYVLILLGFVLLALILFRIRTIVAIIYVSLIISSTLQPVVVFLQRRMPRVVALILIYLGLIGVSALLGLLIIPPLVIQVGSFIALLPEQMEGFTAFLEATDRWFRQAGVPVNLEGLITQASALLGNLAVRLVQIPFLLYEMGASLFATLTLSFYWLLDRERLLASSFSLLKSERQRTRARLIYQRSEQRLGVFVQGLLLASAILGVTTYIGLIILGVPFPLLLALIAAILEVIPILGPIIAAVPIVGLAFAQSPALGLVTLVFWIGIQQLEGYVVTPIVQRQAARLPPFTILVAILIGGALFGILGALLAIPTAVFVTVLLYELSATHEHRDDEDAP
ncbi:MAG: AI-2E family transporter [Chloroflexi bacterium]|nr:AI-2E family transporter [Chloroflexota bacterium]